MNVSLVALGLGARVFEKHFTLDKQLSGPDHFYALEPSELKKYVNNLKELFNSLGSYDKELLDSEREIGRREGLYFKNDLKKGHIILDKDIIIKRPALGIRSGYLDMVLGMKLKRNNKKNTPVFWNDLS